MGACGFESHGFRSMNCFVVPWSSGDDSWPTPRQRGFDSLRDHSSVRAQVRQSAERLGLNPSECEFDSRSGHLARLGRQLADHLGLEPGMLWVRLPPELLNCLSSWSSPECSPACHAGDRGFKSHRGRFDRHERRARYAIRQSGEAQTFVILRVRSPPAPLLGSCSSRRSVKPLSQNKRGGRREVQPLHDPLDSACSSIGSGHRPLKPERRVRFPHGSPV